MKSDGHPNINRESGNLIFLSADRDVIAFDEDADIDVADILRRFRRYLKNATNQNGKNGSIQSFVADVGSIVGSRLSTEFSRQDYVGLEDYLSRKTAYRNAQTDRGYSGETSYRRGDQRATGAFSKRTENRLRSLNFQYRYAEQARIALEETASNSGKIQQGEPVKRDIAVPRKVNGKKTMRRARTFFESESHNERRFVHTRG